MVEVRPLCFLFLLELVGTSGLWTRRGNGTGVPFNNKGSRGLEFGKGGLLGGCGGKSPPKCGHILREKIPHLTVEEATTPASWVESLGATTSKQTPGEAPQADASLPWPRGLCPGTGEYWQLYSSWVVKTSLVCTLGALVAVGNGLVIMVIASSVSGWSHSSRLVLLSLAAADAALALLVVPLNLYRSLVLGPVVEENAGAGDASYCRAVAFINSSIFGASLYSLAGVSLERYVAVFFPLHYWRLLSRRRVALFIMAAWLLPVLLLMPLSVPGPGAVLQVRFSAAALLCEPDYSSNTTYSVLMAGTIFFPAAGTVTFANVCLWLAARSQRRRRKALALPGKEVVRLKRLHLMPLATASRILLPVVIAFYVCWAPCMFTILYNGASGTSSRRLGISYAVKRSKDSTNTLSPPLAHPWKKPTRGQPAPAVCHPLIAFCSLREPKIFSNRPHWAQGVRSTFRLQKVVLTGTLVPESQAASEGQQVGYHR